ncbi:piwi domain-containing protein, partial [Aphelenchoides avenae]
MMIVQEKHHIFPQKMYEKDSAQQLQRDPRVLKSGMQKSLRFVGDSPDEAEPLLQVDPKKAAFFPTGPLGLFLEGFLPPNNRPLHEKIHSGKNMHMAIKQLKNLVVRTNHLEVNQTFAINGLTDKGANEIQFELDGTPVSVFEYFRKKYDVQLRFPKLPCVVHRRVARVGGQNRKVDTYYPIEVLEILDGQRVSIQKQTPALVEQMIRQCQALPRDFQNRNEEQRSKAFIAAGNPYFKAFGVCHPYSLGSLLLSSDPHGHGDAACSRSTLVPACDRLRQQRPRGGAAHQSALEDDPAAQVPSIGCSTAAMGRSDLREGRARRRVP